MCCHSLLQGIFSTQGSNPGLLYCRQTLYHLSNQGSPSMVTSTEQNCWTLTRGSKALIESPLERCFLLNKCSRPLVQRAVSTSESSVMAEVTLALLLLYLHPWASSSPLNLPLSLSSIIITLAFLQGPPQLYPTHTDLSLLWTPCFGSYILLKIWWKLQIFSPSRDMYWHTCLHTHMHKCTHICPSPNTHINHTLLSIFILVFGLI